jgi:hypothetical protein
MAVFPLVSVDLSILSSYDNKGGTAGPRANLKPLQQLGRAGIATPDTAAALKALSDAVREAGGDFRVTECHRDAAVQTAARARYDAWVAAGKPKPGTQRFNSQTMKADYVAIPGKSTHNAGRAIDVHISALNFPDTPANRQLDTLWSLCKPLGWSPIIKEAQEGVSESWHFDFWGELSGVLSRMGYEQAALCGALLVGHAGAFQSFSAVVQALLCRGGCVIGEIDGSVGPRTRAAAAQVLSLSEAEIARRVSAQDATLLHQLAELPAR